MQTSGETCREIAKSHSVVIPAKAGIQYPRDISDGIEKPQRTGCPAFAGHDDVWGAVRSGLPRYARNDVEKAGDETAHPTPAFQFCDRSHVHIQIP